jgi:hypothetical protein
LHLLEEFLTNAPPSPLQAGHRHDDTPRSIAWRCALCARLHLSDEPIDKPERCAGCAGVDLRAAGPDSSRDV